MIRKLLHTSWIVLLLLLALPLGALYYLTCTDAGLRTLAAQLSRRLGPVTLQIRGVSGTLAGGAHIDQVIVDHRRVRVEADDARVRLAVLPLLWQTLRVPAADLRAVRIEVRPRPNEPGTWSPHFLPALMQIQADRLRVAQLVIVAPSGHSVEFDDVAAQGTLHSKRIRVYAGSGLLNGMRLETRGELLAATPLGLRGSVRWRLAPQGQPAWLANATFDGDLARVAIDGTLTEPFRASGHGALLDLAGHWQLAGKARVQHLDPGVWGAGRALGTVSGELEVRGSGSGYGATGRLTPTGLQAGALDVDFFGSYAERTLHVERLRLRHPASGATLQAHGEVGIADHGPSLGLEGEWSGLRWPLAAAAAPIHDSAGSFRLRGLRPYRLDAEGSFAALAWPPASFVAGGTLDHDRLRLDTATLELFGGRAQLDGELRWSPEQSWSATGKVQQLDIAALRPGTHGRLSFGVQLAGRGFGAAGIQARLDDVAGQVDGLRASGHAWLTTLEDGLRFDEVRLRLGQTHIELSGRTGAHNDLRFTIEANDLALLLPEARGHLVASGRVAGSARDPVVALIARGADMAWRDLRLGALRASVDFDPTGSGRCDTLLRLDGLRWRERQIDSITLESQGTAAAYSVGLHVRGPDLDADARGSGRFHDGEWQLQLATLQAVDHKDLKLALEAPTEIVWSARAWRLDRLCLRSELAHLCGSAAAGPEGLRTSVSANGLPLVAFTAGLVPETSFDGTIQVEAALQVPAHGSWSGSVHGELARAAVRHRLRSGSVESLDLGNGSIQLDLLAGGLQGRVLLDAGRTGRLEGQLSASRPAPDADWRDWSLDGQLHADSDAVSFIDSYLTAIDRVTGRLQTQLQVGGRVAAPLLNGSLKVSNAEIDAYQINLALREVNFSAELRDNTLRLQGSGKAGADGHGEVSGTLSWINGMPYGDLHLLGTDLRLANIPEARILASPDVNLKLAGRRIDITGTVVLPYARLEPAELTNAVLASGDEVLVNEPQKPPEQRFHVYSRMTLRLGERVTVDALGLSGRLGGSITVTTDDTGLSRGTGELDVEEGKYLALGRKLDVERGRLLFSNGLLSDPGIDLRATKRFPDITAGVNVRGTLRNPRMTFFSDPTVTQSQIVSLLLAGGSLESVQSTSDSGARGNSARAGLLLQGGAIIGQQIGSKVGIQDVSVESDLSNATSLVLGRYLSPRLYVSYGISLAEAINTIKMRYTIGDRWTIKTEAGKERSADLVYTIEK